MYKNHEGYSSPTEGKAIAKLTKEERTRMLEAKHGIRIGQTVWLYFQERYEGPPVPGKKYIIRKKESAGIRIISRLCADTISKVRSEGMFLLCRFCRAQKNTGGGGGQWS